MLRTITICVAICSIVSSFAISKAYTEGKKSGVRETTVSWQKEKLELQSSHIVEMGAAKAVEQELHRKADVMRQEHKNETNNLRARHNAALASLQQRPEKRASEASSATCVATPSGVGSTGKELAQPDARFLIGYAAEVEQLQQAYNECRQKYNHLRNTL